MKTRVFTFNSKFGDVVKIRAKAVVDQNGISIPGEWLLTAKQAWKVYLMLCVNPEDGHWTLVDDAVFHPNACTPPGARPINGRFIENGLPEKKESCDMWFGLMRRAKEDLKHKGVEWESLSIEEREAVKIEVQHQYLKWYLQRKEELQRQRKEEMRGCGL